MQEQDGDDTQKENRREKNCIKRLRAYVWI